MKSYLSKLGVLLFGAMFAVASCQDYAEDIRQVNTDLSAKIDAAVADLEKKMATAEALKALEDDLKDLQASVDEAVDGLEAAYKAGDKALQDQFNTAIAAANKAINDLSAAYKAADDVIKGDLTAVQGRVTSLATQVAEVSNKADKNAAHIAALATELRAADVAINTLITDLTARVAANEGEIAALKSALETVKNDLENETTARELLAQKHETDKADLLDKINANKTAIEAEVIAREALATTFETYKTENDKKILALENADKELTAAIEKVASDLEAAKTKLEQVITDLLGVKANVDLLLNRVQSLVYVPDFDDHKATILYADINKSKTYIARQSIIRYRVNAKAGESAAKAASDLAEAWKLKPSVLSFEFENVATRSGAEPVASLEIANVKAEKDDLLVYAVAKNFDAKFFESKKNMYSAALVLSDGNNNISSSYTNLTAGEKTNITAVVIDAEGKEITGKTATPEYLPYDGKDPSEVVVLKGHRLGFKVNFDMNKYYTIDEMLEAGYDIDVERRVYATDGVSYSDYSAIDSKPGVIREAGSFNVEEREFVSNNVESDTYVTIKGTVTKDQYKALKAEKQNVLTLDFNYIVNGVTVKTTGLVEMCNRLVTVDLGAVEIPWTLKLADDLYTDAGPYTATVPYVGFPYDVAASANKPLQGYSLYSILQTGTPVKTHGGNYDIQMSINDETLDFKLSGDYAFAPADAEKENWNTYTVQWKNDFDDLTITVKAAIKLGELPAPFVMDDKALDFKIVDGTNDKWVYSQSKIVEKMFTQYRALIGVEKDEDAKALFSKVLKRSTVDAKNTNVNGYDLLEWNITTPINSFDPLTIGLYEEQFAKEGAEKISVAQNDANTGVAFNFYFEGAVSLPNDELAYSTVDFVSYDAEQQRYEVEVDGDIVNNKYTIDQADLGKYFYVTKDAEYLLNNKDLKVKFVIKTKDAPKPVVTDVVGVYNDAASGINVLEDGQSIINDWTSLGQFGGNEILVEATLYAHGFAVDTKEVTLFTVDPLNFTKIKDIEVERVPGQDAVAYTHSVLSLTETISGGIGGNLIKTDSYPSQIFADSKADVIYGAKFIPSEKYPTYNCRLVSVWTGDREAGTAEEYPSNKYIFNNGKITLKADDGLLKQPIFAEVEYVLTHDYNYGKNETVVVKVTFQPNNAL